MAYGFDYGHGVTNIDVETGIRFGVISQNAILQSWADSSQADYGAPHCPKCGEEAQEAQLSEATPDDSWEVDGNDYVCESCKYGFDSSDAYGDALAWTLDDGEYKAQQSGDDTDIFVVKSPYYTHATHCSPCAPGACSLESPTDDNGPRAYCFAADWFDNDSPCPYPVFRVVDNVCIYRPKV